MCWEARGGSWLLALGSWLLALGFGPSVMWLGRRFEYLSRKAAEECSPGRKPWVRAGHDQALKGRKKGRPRTSSRLLVLDFTPDVPRITPKARATLLPHVRRR